jgi:hypothetical protein
MLILMQSAGKFPFTSWAASILCGILLTSCATHRTGETSQSRDAVENQFIELPKIAVEGVNYEDGIQYKEAVILCSEYFRRYLGLCGMPDTPDSGPEFWQSHMWRGIAGSYAGRLWIAKDGSKVLIEPARKSITTLVQKHLQTETSTPSSDSRKK